MLTTNGAFLAAPQALMGAAAFLLVSSNTLLMPLMFSLFLARVIAE
jgi:hypothetical protein